MNLKETFTTVQAASRKLALLDDQTINRILNAVADAAIAETPFILSENAKDLARMEQSNPKYDRLKLTEARLKGIAADTRNVATLPSPLGRVLKETVRPNGMKLTKVSVPFGVIGIIYEARPNVSFDVFSLCLKSGNACMLQPSHSQRYPRCVKAFRRRYTYRRTPAGRPGSHGGTPACRRICRSHHSARQQ